MSNEQFLILMTKKAVGEATEAELRELQVMLQADETLREQYITLSKYLSEPSYNISANKEAALQKMLIRINESTIEERDLLIVSPVITAYASKPRSMFAWKFAVAAAAVLVIAVSIFVFIKNDVPKVTVGRLVEKENAKGIKSTIVLTDGSKIWLNADSRISYPEVFTGNTREVSLDGEAFFDIAKNPARPFIIHLANGTVKVVGTSFNIRAYASEKIIETSVATGKVAFIPKYEGDDKKQDTIYLTPENKVRFSFEKHEIITQPTVSADDKAWTEGKLIFRSMLFKDIAAELERNFGKQFVFKDEELKNYRLTGSFQNNTLDEILYYLSKTKTFSYIILDEQIIISR